MSDVFDKLCDTTGWVRGDHDFGWLEMPYRHTLLRHMKKDCSHGF